jgi:predicted phosphodiesterase
MTWQAPDVLLAVLSDIHGNLPALEAVLAELERERVDELVCLGDVALGPNPAESLALVRGLGCAVVMGNWDAWVLEGFPSAHEDPWKRFVEQGEWWARTLSAKDRAFIRTFVPRIQLGVDRVQVLGFHGSPLSYDDMILATTPHDELLGMLEGFDHPLMLAGHTHVQLARVVDGRLVVNPGSVGLPFRGLPAGELQLISPWAEYALVRLEDSRISVDLRRTSYDVDGMIRDTIESGAPHAAWWAETWVRPDPRLPLGPRPRHL